MNRFRGKLYLSLLVSGFIVSHGAVAQGKAVTRNVCPTGCTYSSIQAAIIASNSGDTILVGNGTYAENIELLDKNLILKAKTSGTFPTIDGSHVGTVVFIGGGQNSTTILDGFRIKNGTAGMRTGNSGGGIYIATTSSTSPAIKNCIIENNDAAVGGGIAANSLVSPLFSYCKIINNTSSGGGGGVFLFNSATIDGCIISGNASGDNGGGIASNGGPSIAITNSIISGNTAGLIGGGIHLLNYAPSTISNCTITGNSASYGGGISSNDASPFIVNSIIYNNNSGDIYVAGSYYGKPTISYSDFASVGGMSDYVDGGGNINVDPLFQISADPHNPSHWTAWDLHLKTSPTRSPCIDKGNNAFAFGLDIDGGSRIVDGDGNRIATVDIGADEASRR